jgi:hypothetical protein
VQRFKNQKVISELPSAETARPKGKAQNMRWKTWEELHTCKENDAPELAVVRAM